MKAACYDCYREVSRYGIAIILCPVHARTGEILAILRDYVNGEAPYQAASKLFADISKESA